MSLATIADELTKSSAFRDPYSQPAYGTRVSREERSGHVIEVFYDAVCRDFVGAVDGEFVGNYERHEIAAYTNASRQVSYLVEEEARAKARAEAEAEALQAEIQAEFEIEEARAGVSDAARPRQGGTKRMNTQAQKVEQAHEVHADHVESLRRLSIDRANALEAKRQAEKDLKLAINAAIISINEEEDGAGKKRYSNPDSRKAALELWKLQEGEALLQADEAASTEYRRLDEAYEIKLEETKAQRMYMYLLASHFEYLAAELKNLPF